MGVLKLFYESIWRDVYVKKIGRNVKCFFLDGVECKENLSNIRRLWNYKSCKGIESRGMIFIL